MSLPVPAEILSSIEENVGMKPLTFSFSGGGCINHGGKLTTSVGIFFLKWNDVAAFPGMFTAEARGLQLLKSTGTLRIPDVIFSGITTSFQYILIEFIGQGIHAKNYWETFGLQLAALHAHTSASFGLDHDNYIGSLRQSNKQHQDGYQFFIQERLHPQVQLAVRNGLLTSAVELLFEKLYLKLPDLLPDERPSMLHGDLWGGNLLCDESGNPSLIDPAVCFGFREADLAMTTLFGGFDNSFLMSYKETFPLAAGYDRRFEIYNLYPLLVHVNLFGRGYAPQVVSIVKNLV